MASSHKLTATRAGPLVALTIAVALAASGCWGSDTESSELSAPSVISTATSSESSAAATSTTPTSELSAAEGAHDEVLSYLSALARGDFETAASSYGGETSGYPGNTKAERLKNMVRLSMVFSPRAVRVDSHGWEQVVWVQLIQLNGQPYVHVPPQDSPNAPTDEFAFTVVRVDGKWWVMDLPPYEE